MVNKLSFRKKILFCFLLLFLLFVTALYPLTNHITTLVYKRYLKQRTEEIIFSIQKAPSLALLVEQLKTKENRFFFQVSLIDPTLKFLYDSSQESDPKKIQEDQQEEHPELQEALEKGSGDSIGFSSVFEQKMAYSALRFPYKGQEYILRIGFPYRQVYRLINNFSYAFLFFGLFMLLLFGLVIWLAIAHFTRPIQKIMDAIAPYQEGKSERIPEIILGNGSSPEDEFSRLAETLNHLSKKVEQQVATLLRERNDKVAILETLGEGVIAVDASMHINYVNQTAKVLLGAEEEEILGKSFLEAHQPQCDQLLREAQSKEEVKQVVLKPEGKPKRYLDVFAFPRGEEGAILVVQDKTSLHKIIELGRDFIANASHELKTPITIIRGFAETLHDHPELSQEVFQEITQMMVANCQRMDTLVKNLLALAAVDEGLPLSRLQESDITQLVDEAKQTILAVHPTAQISLKTTGEPPYSWFVDGDLLLQAIINLLDNAVKYSTPPAHISVEIEKKPEEMILRVTDRGMGISRKDLERIFERFYAVDKSRSRSLGGSGLGLSIVEVV